MKATTDFVRTCATNDSYPGELLSRAEFDEWLAEHDAQVRSEAQSFGGIFMEWAHEYLTEVYPGGIPEGTQIAMEENLKLERYGTDEWINRSVVVIRIPETNYSRTFTGTGGDLMKEVSRWDMKRRGM